MTRDPLDVLAGTATPPPMSRALEHELARLAPVPLRRPWRRFAIVLAVSIGWAAAVVLALPHRRDLGTLPLFPWLASTVLRGLGFVAALAIALVPPPGSMFHRRQAAAIGAIGAATAAIALGFAVHPSSAASVELGWTGLSHGAGCLVLGLVIAVVPVAACAIAVRRAVPVGTRWIFAAIGAAAGCLAGAALQFICPIGDAPHVGLIHGAVVGVAAALCAAIARA
ncbi:MAG: NrsF family protein [Kofleriaceae bacterium]